ncbi:agenet domain-containing protein [Sorangium cellulosum]|uniref:agenet domain-containing protein n=1 Tax=Sorangium cellulosum TaxID=56 RepID=UPI000CF5762F|nr:agenet domain-containing protein [Sorangium cellulosum]
MLLLVAACAPACGARQAEQPAPLAAAPQLAPGTPLLVERGGLWLPATVVGALGPDRVIVHYDGTDPAWDEPVSFDRIRAAPPAGAADYRAGEKVLVTAQGRLLLADVVQQIGPDAWRIHYDGYPPEIAEDVKLDRLRRPFAGPAVYPAGEPVEIDAGGRMLRAVVLAPIAADRWLVRLEGFGPEYDQEVTYDRLRPRAPAAAPAAEPAPAAAAAPPASPAPPPPASTATAASASPARSFQVGEEVLVAHRGVYHLATVVSPSAGGNAGGKWRVRYKSSAVGSEGTLDGSDEEVAADRLSRFASSPKGAPFAASQRVFVEYHGLYFPGHVVRTVDKGQARIRFENFGPEADEIIPIRRLRPRT